MKTLDQIIRYTSHCQFQNDDWQQVLAYCREQFGGGKIHKAIKPISNSTYEQFMDWIREGFGSGDNVSYGNTMGIIGSSTPEKTILAAYCDYKGNLIVKDMEVLEPSRLRPLDEERKHTLKRLMFEKRLDFSIRTGALTKMYTPKENFYVTLGEGADGNPNVGMYLSSDGCKYHFAAFIQNGEIKMDCWIDSDYTPLKLASDKDIQRFHKIMAQAGWSYNGRVNKYIQLPKRVHDHVYWYLNERFEIVMDRDNGADKHTARFKAGNYFLDYERSLRFMEAVKEMSKGGL